jgi:hypothetical protein
MKYLVAHACSGLGNRIRCLVAARRAARLTGRQLALIWPLDPYHCYCQYQQLFQTPQLLVSDELFANTLTENYMVSYMPTFIVQHSQAEAVYVQEQNFFWVDGDSDIMWGQFSPYKMKNLAVRNELLSEFAALQPCQEVSRKVDSFAQEHFAEEVIGVHIRREDNYWSNRFCSDRLFIESARDALTYLPEAKLFLATDDEQSEASFRGAFGDRVLTYPPRSLERGRDWQAVQDALVILLLLARTHLIIRSCSSTFSQVASWFGQVPTIDVGLLEHTS